jgi:20S proteasome alpha/beta subunit
MMKKKCAIMVVERELTYRALIHRKEREKIQACTNRWDVQRART